MNKVQLKHMKVIISKELLEMSYIIMKCLVPSGTPLDVSPQAPECLKNSSAHIQNSTVYNWYKMQLHR